MIAAPGFGLTSLKPSSDGQSPCEAGEDGMRVLLDYRREALGRFDAIVIGQDVDRQRLLDRRAVVARAAVDPLETVVAADHQKTAAVLDIGFQRAQAVGGAPAVDPGVGMQRSVFEPMSERMTAS